MIDELAKKIETLILQIDETARIRSMNDRQEKCENILFGATMDDTLRQMQDCILQLAAAREKIKELEQWKTLGCEYSSCLQKLCMDVLYKHCEPVSYGWPGKKHTDTIVEGVNFLLARIAELEAKNDRLWEEFVKEYNGSNHDTRNT